jgi:uncharacterized protein (DUF1810 family)
LQYYQAPLKKPKMDIDLNRFIEAQESEYIIALSEIKSGKKKSHWMWFIFPQIAGLGFSETSRFYAIKNIDEATIYLNHPILGFRLRAISNALLNLKENNANIILGAPDDVKLKSCMTLFAVVEDSKDNVFNMVLHKFFNGKADEKTLKQLKLQV